MDRDTNKLARSIGYFRVPKTLTFKMRLGAQPSFICIRMKNDFHITGWAPTLVLKQRPGELGNGLLFAKGVSDYVRDKVSRGAPEAVPSLVRCNLRFVFRKIQHLLGHLHRNFLPKPGGSTRKERVMESEMCINHTKIIKLQIVWAMSTKDGLKTHQWDLESS